MQTFFKFLPTLAFSKNKSFIRKIIILSPVTQIETAVMVKRIASTNLDGLRSTE